MKRLSLLLVALLVSQIWLPLAPYVRVEKSYSYAQDIIPIPLHGTPSFARSASIGPIAPIISGFSYTGTVRLSDTRNSFTLKIEQSPDSFSQEDSVRVVWKSGNDTQVRSLDLGNGRDGIMESAVFTEPAVFADTTEASYEILSDRALTGRVSLSAVDVNSSTSHLVIDTDTASAAGGDARIISRASWGADESIRYQDSTTWKAYYAKLAATANNPITAAAQAYKDKVAKLEDHLKQYFPDDYETVDSVQEESGHPLVWPIEHTKSVKKIVIHHTAENNLKNLSNEALLRSIYYYHSATRGWGDIGYNYIIGQRGEIYEGRAGGDYVVGAHASWNNRSTVGISVIGNFETDNINSDQETGIKSSIKYLATKYGIDLSKSSYGHRECQSNSQSCATMEDTLNSNIVGHRDVGYTSCPGKNLYAMLPDFRSEATYSFGLTPKLNAQYAASASIDPVSSNLKKWPDMRVLLSYPSSNSVTIAGLSSPPRFQAGKVGGTLKKNIPLTIEAKWSNLTLVLGAKKYKLGTEAVFSSDVLQVKSWNRKPSWDTSGKLNDNLFRGSIRVRANAGKIELVNILPLEHYLYGIAEVSNGDPAEKIKTILVAARSYAYFYTDSAHRKFPGKDYDGSDNPDIFQKYLGYGYELRSPNTAKYVNETNGIMVTYKGIVVKPWYFSESDGRVRSYKEYCESHKSANSTVACEDIPYLQGGPDPGGAGHTLKGHGVGLSGIGATYFATNLEWGYSQILAYYYNGTDTEKIY